MFKMYYLFLIFIFSTFTVTTLGEIVENNKKAIFTLMTPKVMRSNTSLDIAVFTEKGENNLLVNLKLTCGSVHFSSQESEIPPGTSDIISLDVTRISKDSCSLTVKAKFTGAETNDSFENTKTLRVDSKSIKVLIQLDKPIYKPGETVKFRVIALNRLLRPHTVDKVDIKIVDPQMNIIKVLKKQSILKGIFSGEMKLSPEPILGDWNIQADIGNAQEKLKFTVAHYVLPKFKIEVKVPPFIVDGTKKIKAEIKATYTYGKGVKGEATVQLDYRDTYGIYDDIYYKRAVRSSPLRIRPNPRPRPRDSSTIFAVTTPIDGSVFVNLEIPEHLQRIRNNNEREFIVEATVTEAITKKEMNGTARVKMYAHAYKIEMIKEAKNYKPGLPLKITFKVSTQDGVPIQDDRPDALTVSHGFAYDDKDSTLTSSIPSTGIVSFTVMTPSNENINIKPFTVTYKELVETFSVPEKYSTKSKTYIDLSIEDPDNPTTIKVRANKPIRALNYLVITQGKIVDRSRLNLNEGTKDTTIQLKESAELRGSKISVVVYTVTDKNEIVVDSINFSYMTTKNCLNIELSKKTVEPGENVTISLETIEKSLVALRAVDQSVLLLKDDKDIDVKRVEEISKYFDEDSSYNSYWGSSLAMKTFESADLVIFTNAQLEEINRYPIWWDSPMGFKGAAVPGAPLMMAQMAAAPMIMDASESGAGGASASSVTIEAPRVRDKFPESWIWETIDVMENITTISEIAPDTLTSWVLTGFSLSPETGLGVSVEPSILQTFRPFFITLNLPYSVVKGEVFALQVLLHNYMTDVVDSQVILRNDKKQFKFLNDKDGAIKASELKTVKIPPAQVASVTFVIIPMKIGDIKLELTAMTPLAGDAISQPLTVKPPGFLQSKNNAVLLDVRSKGRVNLNLSAVFPKQRIPDADSVKFSVIGDLLGSTISNLDKLIQMPCGCGEQNMLNFVPDIVILDYLGASHLLTSSTKILSLALNFLEIGYQRELTYRHMDGSFSAFGQSDAFGSTWLTAFVARSFIAAKKYITIDDDIIARALEYLSKNQDDSGLFLEKGNVIHSEMKGGASSGVALTAYVALSFVEASKMKSKSPFKYTNVLGKTFTYLSDQMTNINDPYSVILICYVLHLANHPKKDAAFSIVEKLAQRDGQLMFWSNSMTVVPPQQPSERNAANDGRNADIRMPGPPMPWVVEKPPVAVEMTAYALLSYIMRNNITECISIAKWLLAQRNSNGGFLSTQDTVVGLTALAEFALKTKSGNPSMTVTVAYSTKSQIFTINQENNMVLQEYILPANVSDVSVTATGKGSAMAQLSWNYYVDVNALQPAFTIKVQVRNSEDSQAKFSLNICTAYTKGNSSNMAVLEVNLPSGYVFEADSLMDLTKIPKLMRYEQENDNTKLNIYFTDISTDKTCLQLEAARLFLVAKLSQSAIIIYDYYDTTKRARAFYDAPAVSICDLCSVEKTCEVNNCVAQ